MQAGQHQRAIWPQHPAQLAQGGHPVIDVFDRQRAQDQVDALIGQPADPIAQVVHAELALADPGPADLHHPRAVVEPHHLRPATDQLGGIKARAARCVQDPLARHIAQQRQAGWPVIAGVVEPAPGMAEKLISEYVVLRLAPNPGVHAAYSYSRRR
jgi:hypothetical protein